MSASTTRPACKGKDPELWFPIGTNGPALRQTKRALALCGICPLREPCLAGALERGETAGIWGGATEEDRKAIRRQQGLAGRVASTNPCGTPAGAQQHADKHERLCDDCRTAAEVTA